MKKLLLFTVCLVLVAGVYIAYAMPRLGWHLPEGLSKFIPTSEVNAPPTGPNGGGYFHNVLVQRLAECSGVSIDAPKNQQIVWAASLFAEMNPDVPTEKIPAGETIFDALTNHAVNGSQTNIEIFVLALPSLAAQPSSTPSDSEFGDALKTLANHTGTKDYTSLMNFKGAWASAKGEKVENLSNRSLLALIQEWQRAIVKFTENPGVDKHLNQEGREIEKKDRDYLQGDLQQNSSHPLLFVTLKDCVRWANIEPLLTGDNNSVPSTSSYAASEIGNIVDDVRTWTEEPWEGRIAHLLKPKAADNHPSPTPVAANLVSGLAGALNQTLASPK
jgi:hypothetical protein